MVVVVVAVIVAVGVVDPGMMISRT